MSDEKGRVTVTVEAADLKVTTQGWFIDLGGLWVKYDTIGTIKEVVGAGKPEGPYCQVVLTIPGYKTLGVHCAAEDLITVVEALRTAHEEEIGYDRAKGMRHQEAGYRRQPPPQPR